MREIMFRGKRIDNGEWVEAPTFMCAKDVDGGEEAFYLGARNPMIKYDDKFGNIGLLEACTDNPILYKVTPETIGQYTGQKDTNGDMIFEGDILRSGDFDEESGFGVVRWYDGAWEIGNDEWCGTFHENYNGFEFEIIGNIHDNPELLANSQ